MSTQLTLVQLAWADPRLLIQYELLKCLTVIEKKAEEVRSVQVFDTLQINNLLMGIGLACELEATSEMNRAFVKVQVINKQKFINKIDPNSAIFYLRKYEVASKYLDNDWDVTDDELFDSVYEVDIIGIENLEIQLGKYLDDFRRLVSEWKCDNPL